MRDIDNCFLAAIGASSFLELVAINLHRLYARARERIYTNILCKKNKLHINIFLSSIFLTNLLRLKNLSRQNAFRPVSLSISFFVKLWFASGSLLQSAQL